MMISTAPMLVTKDGRQFRVMTLFLAPTIQCLVRYRGGRLSRATFRFSSVTEAGVPIFRQSRAWRGEPKLARVPSNWIPV